MTASSPISIQPKIVEAVWSRLHQQFANGQTSFTTDDWLQLRNIFGDILDRSLYLLDHTNITRFDLKDGHRSLLEVPGSTGCVYKIFPNVNFCSCESFKYQVLLHRHQFTCKHVLAAKLAVLLGRLQVESIPADQFNYLLKQVSKQI